MSCRCQYPEEHGNWLGARSAMAADIARVREFSPLFRPQPGLKTTVSILLLPNVLCLVLYRISHLLFLRGCHRAASALWILNLLMHKVNLPPDSCIGMGCFLPHPAGVTFHGLAGERLTLFSLAIALPDYGASDAAPRLGRQVTMGGHAVALGAARVEDHVKIAPKAVLTGAYPANVMVVSNGFGRRLMPCDQALEARAGCDRPGGLSHVDQVVGQASSPVIFTRA